MPTAARLVAAVLYALIAFFAASAIPETLTNSSITLPDYFAPSIMAIGVWQGWMVLGKQVGRGYTAAIGNGIRTSIQIAFFALLLWSLTRMFYLAVTRTTYRDFGVAVFDALGFFLEFTVEFISQVDAVAIVIGGGIIAGIVCEAIHRIGNYRVQR
ncbi:MAG: TrgA family protein [Pseudomonadota bacterium]